jgi:hypothetical protein
VDDAEQEAVAAQLAEMREHLLRDAAVAGTPADAVNAAVDEVAAGYADAQVGSFIGVLVEREVRTRLQLRPNLETAALGEPDAERSSKD